MDFQSSWIDSTKLRTTASFFFFLARALEHAFAMAGAALGWIKSLLGEGEEEQGQGPHRWVNGADVEELRSGSSEALGGCDEGELGWTESSWRGCQRGKRRQLQHSVDQLWWRGCSVRHRQDGEQASTGGASTTAPASSVWRAPDSALGPVELRDASAKTVTASGAWRGCSWGRRHGEARHWRDGTAPGGGAAVEGLSGWPPDESWSKCPRWQGRG
jgi:hypothetical protein